MKKMPRTTIPKTIRLTEEEARRAGELLPQFPECVSEADLLRQATLIGLYVLAAQATGTPAYGGYGPDELTALLKYRVLPAIDFLFERDAFPVLYRQKPADAASGEVEIHDITDVDITRGAADDLEGLGTGFMD